MVDAMSHKDRTRVRILDEAAAAMRASGYEGISVAALMKRAGLTHGGFYAHFKSRDDLVAHTIDRMFADSAAMLKRHLDDRGPREGLTGLIDYYLSDRVMHARDRGCPLPSLSGEAARMPEAARARFVAGTQRFRSRLAQTLAAMNAPEPETLAASVLAEMVGAMALARAEPDETAGEALLAATRERLKTRLLSV
jgi:TetR/AcrR family transcriptional repressor of nem operon